MTVVFITSGTTWTVPSDCNLVSQVDCIGAGGSGAVIFNTTGGAQGGGGGAFSRNTTSISVTPGSSINIGVGTGGTGATTSFGTLNGFSGGGTWWNATSLVNAVSNGTSISCGADGGKAGTICAGNGSIFTNNGGSTLSGVGTTKSAGGSGGTISSATSVATGGGGAAGLNGAGNAGGGGSGTQGTSGGSGDLGSGGAGSFNATSGSSSAGGTGNEYGTSHGSGGGSGAVLSTGSGGTSGVGGPFGGGSGASKGVTFSVSSGNGGNGLIVITYTPVVPVPFNSTVNPPTFQPTQLPQLVQPLNTNLFSVVVVSNPFFQTDWSAAHTIPDMLPGLTLPNNINIYTNPFPNNQYEWGRQRFPLYLTPDNNPNIVIHIGSPVFPKDWSKTQFLSNVPSPYMALNINLYSISPSSLPFNQYDWVKVYSIKSVPLNINLPDLVLQNFSTPFVNVDWSRPPPLFRALVNPDLPNVVLLQPISSIPFNQYSWINAYPIKHIDAGQIENNLPNFVFTQPIPFNQIDWAKPYTFRQVIGQSSNPNVALLTPIVTTTTFHALPFLITLGPITAR